MLGGLCGYSELVTEMDTNRFNPRNIERKGRVRGVCLILSETRWVFAKQNRGAVYKVGS
jgi:hypothetical protein